MSGRLERTLASTASETTNSDFSSSGTSKHYGCSLQHCRFTLPTSTAIFLSKIRPLGTPSTALVWLFGSLGLPLKLFRTTKRAILESSITEAKSPSGFALDCGREFAQSLLMHCCCLTMKPGSYSRHPNYCGEVLAWIGVALMCCSTMTLWGYTALLSPLFVYALLTKVSGVPMLEAKAEKLWGNNPQYQKYKASTPVMFF